MKGIILAGGQGTRLLPMTRVTNKHLLPVYDKPMIYYPIETLKHLGVTDIMIITGNESAGDFLNLLGDGSEFGVNFTFRIQKKSNGIAGALSLCEDFAGDNRIAVILGDNIFDNNAIDPVCCSANLGGMIFLKEVDDPERFGVAEIRLDKVENIEEKPLNPKSNLVVTGLYIYDHNVWNVIRYLKPSDRGELEITDVNNWYIEKCKMNYSLVEGFWSDAGTVPSLFTASMFISTCEG